MKYTPNLNLKKPDKTDPVLIDDLNDNMDILDQEVQDILDILDNVENDFIQHKLDYTEQVVKVKNLVINGNFSNGITGWQGVYGSITSLNGEGVYTITTPHASSMRIETPLIKPTNTTDKYYVSVMIKPKYSKTLRVVFGDKEFGRLFGVEVIANSYNTISAINTATNITSPLRIYFADTIPMDYTTGDQIFIKNVMLINLTEVFGVGNEPTKEEMDKLVAIAGGYFNSATDKVVMNWMLDKIRSINSQSTDMVNKVGTLETNVSTLETNVSTLETNVGLLQSSVNTLSTGKVDKVPGKGLSDNNYTTLEKIKVANLPEDTNARLATIEDLVTNVVDGEIQAVLNNEIVATDIKSKLNALETMYTPRLSNVEMESIIRNNLTRNKAKIREQIYPYSQTKNVLLLYHNNPTTYQKIVYTACKSILTNARIPFSEALFDTMPPSNATDYSMIIVPHVSGTDIYNNPTGLFGGNVGVPVIAFGGGAGWDGRTNITHVSTPLTDGTYHYKLPGGYDYYTQKANVFCNATISNMTDVENVIYDPLDNTKSHMWIVNGPANKTLWMPSHNDYPLPPALLYYVKLWGGYKNALMLPLCYDLDDANIAEEPWVADVQGLSDLYDFAKPLNMLITAGIKTDYLTGATVSRFPTAEPSEQTAFLRDHQDVYIPIVHDHHYANWGGTRSKALLLAQHKERLEVARSYGFAIPDDMYGYLYQPENEYNENAIEVWKEIGIVAARDSGAPLGVWSSDGVTPIPIGDRYALSKDKLLWVNACQYINFDSRSLADDLAKKAYTEEEWKGLAINRTMMALWSGFPTAPHKSITDDYTTRASVVYFHGTNVSGDNPVLIGMQLVEGVRQAFPGTFCYTHPSSLINRTETTYLADVY